MPNDKTTRMDPALKAKWVEALRSGEYEQAHHQAFDGRGYCCLGVYAKVCGTSNERLDGITGVGSVGNVTCLYAIDFDDRCHLAGMNDNGVTFPEIADYIEGNL